MIAIVDYNMGNLKSVCNSFEKLGEKAEVVSDCDALKKYDKIILPGVGAYKDAMESLDNTGMIKAVREFANSGKPLLGICLGMQLLFDRSCEFGETKGLGLIEGEVVEFDRSKVASKLKVPHMGWNEIFVQKDSPLFKGLPKEIYLYFVHSFHVVCDDSFVIGKTTYGYEFPSAVQKDNIFGIQPHPEKSHDNGLKILKNFVEL
ncbi:MAG: imidazole glycerol phosphate synthase subunit HisH [Sulfurospirillaceae bacterium]|nr:imidazole glycerol phosphate synthase subunit HisH [Sulfurospirillaceae bacterium]